MKEKKEEKVLEREYIVPLRSEWLKVQHFKRANKAVKALKQFIAKHMGVEDRDTRKVRVNKWVNNELWFRGMKKPLNKIKVKAIKNSEGIVRVELVDIPAKIKFLMENEAKKLYVGKEKAKQAEKKPEEEKSEETKEEKSEKKETEEKKKSAVEAGMKDAKTEAKHHKHEVSGKNIQKQPQVRKALSR